MRACEYRVEHGRRQAAGIRVVATAMIGVEQQETTRHAMFGGMAELEIRLPQSQRLDYGAVCNTAEGEHHGIRMNTVDFVFQELVAGADLGAASRL